jgi:hypothetical protein
MKPTGFSDHRSNRRCVRLGARPVQVAPPCRLGLRAIYGFLLHAPTLWVLFTLLIVPAPSAFAATGDFLLLRRSIISGGGDAQPIRLASINEHVLEYLDETGQSPNPKVPLDDCVALLNPYSTARPLSKGLVTLADGQRLPGEALANDKTQAESLGWAHPWLGRVDVPLKHIQSVVFTPQVTSPPPPGKKADVVLLANGDRQEGLILTLGPSISMEVDREGARSNIDIPMNIVAAMTMINSRQPSSGRRVWFEDGTVIDVQSVAVGDDGYVRLGGSAFFSAGGSQPPRVGLSQIAAVLFDSKAMVPLAALAPLRVEGPPTRYVVPRPVVGDRDAPLGLSSIEYRGPLVVRYSLPAGAQRFLAEAQLPRSSMKWGDFELIIRMNDQAVFSRRINAANPVASINIATAGSTGAGGGVEMTIEITQGANGPIQDQVILTRAMVLKK